jgi:glycosyltransferase involved in cell wall biosynthesis
MSNLILRERNSIGSSNLDVSEFARSGWRPRRVAVVHDWLVTYGGAERVLEQILDQYPHADLFTLCDYLPEEHRGFLKGRQIHTSFLQHLPRARAKYRSYLALMPLAIERFDLRGYDLVISSSFAVAKGVITGPDQLHVCMCYSPMRYAWDLTHQYLHEAKLTKGVRGLLAHWLLHRMRLWDARTANGVDEFIAISQYIARRIMKVYRRPSTVIYPPVDVERFTLREQKENFYLAASRLVPYKRIDLIVEAFSRMPDRKLVVIGDGPDFKKIRRLAGPNVHLMGAQATDVLCDHMQRARGFLFAAEEDFGIVPVEAQACGTPVIAFRRGGQTETIVEGETGLFFAEQEPDCLIDAVQRFEKHQFAPHRIRRNAVRFARVRFKREFHQYMSEVCEAYAEGKRMSQSAISSD